MEAAGAVVEIFEEFGSYQGEWWAKVSYGGKIGWVNGSYGSCSGCDAFEAEFGWDDPSDEKLAEFGRGYLDNIMTQDEAIKSASQYIEWDMDAKKMVDFIKSHPL